MIYIFSDEESVVVIVARNIREATKLLTESDTGLTISNLSLVRQPKGYSRIVYKATHYCRDI